MTLRVWLEPDESEVVPGEATTLVLHVENLGEVTESLSLVPTGLTASWIDVTRPSVTVFGRSSDAIDVIVRPPAYPTTTAGPTTVAVRVVPLVDTESTAVAEATVHVLAFDDRRIVLLQPIQRARRRATFELMVENHGNNLASCRLHLIDPSNRVDGTFDPPAVGVPPGDSALVRLRLRTTSLGYRRRDRQLDFEVEARQTDHRTASARAALIQPPTVPPRAVGRIAAVAVVVGAVVAAWFGVVRPELREAAERAVDERVDDLTGAPTTAPGDEGTGDGTGDEPGGDGPGADPAGDDATGDPATGTATGTAPGASEEGEPFVARLALSISAGGTNADSARVPDGRRLLLTDIVLQNPNGDLGRAALLRDSALLYDWDLGEMTTANEFQPRLTPLPFDGGSEVVFRATCDTVGSATSTVCEVAVLLVGRLVDAPDG